MTHQSIYSYKIDQGAVVLVLMLFTKWHHQNIDSWKIELFYAVHKVAPIRVLIAEKLNYFMT